VRDRILRNHSPEGVHQEICGYYLAHYAIRAMMHDAALQRDLDPQRLSFPRVGYEPYTSKRR